MGVLLPVITVTVGRRGAASLVFDPSLLRGPHRHSVCSTSMLPFPEGGAQRGANGRLSHGICWTSDDGLASFNSKIQADTPSDGPLDSRIPLKYAKRGLVNRHIASRPEVFIVVFSTAKVCAGCSIRLLFYVGGLSSS